MIELGIFLAMALAGWIGFKIGQRREETKHIKALEETVRIIRENTDKRSRAEKLDGLRGPSDSAGVG